LDDSSQEKCISISDYDLGESGEKTKKTERQWEKPEWQWIEPREEGEGKGSFLPFWFVMFSFFLAIRKTFDEIPDWARFPFHFISPKFDRRTE
jgi:hypothetical protein